MKKTTFSSEVQSVISITATTDVTVLAMHYIFPMELIFTLLRVFLPLNSLMANVRKRKINQVDSNSGHLSADHSGKKSMTVPHSNRFIHQFANQTVLPPYVRCRNRSNLINRPQFFLLTFHKPSSSLIHRTSSVNRLFARNRPIHIVCNRAKNIIYQRS